MNRTMIIMGAAPLVVALVAATPVLAQDTTVVSLAPVSDYVMGLLAVVIPIVLTWALSEVRKWADQRAWLSQAAKDQAMVALESMANKAIDAGTTALAKYASSLKVPVGNPQVNAIAGYIVHQAPKLLRDANMSEAQVAAWITRKLAIMPPADIAPPTPGRMEAIEGEVSDAMRPAALAPAGLK